MGASRDRKGHPKSQQSSKVCLGTHAGSVAGWSQPKIGLQNRPERLQRAFGAVNTMLLAHCTKSIRGHFLVHVCCLSASFEHGFGPQNRTQPEKVDSKKYDKIELKNDPKKALKWRPTLDPRTVFLMYFSLLYPSWGPRRSQGRHKGAEATKMMPELPQRVHKLVLKSHTNAVNHCQSLGKMPTKSIHTSTHSRCSTSACTYI